MAREKHPKIKRYDDMALETNRKTMEIVTKFEKDTPPPKEFEFSPVAHTIENASSMSHYRRLAVEASMELDLAKRTHAKITQLVRAYYKGSKMVDMEIANRWGWDDLCRETIMNNELDFHIQADDLYIAATEFLAAAQRRIDTLKEIEKCLVERGRQYKTAAMLLTNNAG